MKGTWQSTDSGSGGGTAAVVIAAVILVAAIAGPVATAAAELGRVLFIAVAVLVLVAVTGGGALLAHRLRRGRPAAPLAVHRVTPVTRPAAESLPGPQPRAIDGPREVHLHFHGMTAEDVAAILARVNRERD